MLKEQAYKSAQRKANKYNTAYAIHFDTVTNTEHSFVIGTKEKWDSPNKLDTYVFVDYIYPTI